MNTYTIAKRVLSDAGNVLVVSEDDHLGSLRDLGERGHSGGHALLIEVDEDVVQEHREWRERVEMVFKRSKS